MVHVTSWAEKALFKEEMKRAIYFYESLVTNKGWQLRWHLLDTITALATTLWRHLALVSILQKNKAIEMQRGPLPMATRTVIGRGRKWAQAVQLWNLCIQPLWFQRSCQTWRALLSLLYSRLLSMAASSVTRSQLRHIICDIFAFYRPFWDILLILLLDVSREALMVRSSQTQQKCIIGKAKKWRSQARADYLDPILASQYIASMALGSHLATSLMNYKMGIKIVLPS